MGDLEPLVLLRGVLSGDGVGTAVDATVVAPVAEGVGVWSRDSLLLRALLFAAAAAAADDVFNNDVTSISPSSCCSQFKSLSSDNKCPQR